jgi:hypothetical protein
MKTPAHTLTLKVSGTGLDLREAMNSAASKARWEIFYAYVNGIEIHPNDATCPSTVTESDLIEIRGW